MKNIFLLGENYLQDSLYNSPAKLKALLAERGLGMQKKFGQNFLIDQNIRTKLISFLGLNENDTVWEIGPGLGSMTELLLQSKAKVKAFEIDTGFIKFLKESFSSYNNFTLIEGDVLKNWQNEAKVQVPKFFFGNLPYNIAATLILDTVEHNVFFDTCVITVQKEVADRFASKVGGEDYSATSILVQAFYDVKSILTISPRAFWPEPNVVSKAISLKRNSTYTEALTGNEKMFFELTKALFFARRKTIKNNFQKWLKEKGYETNLAEKIFSPELLARRAETLTIDETISIMQKVKEAIKS